MELGTVTRMRRIREGAAELEVAVGGSREKAINYERLTGVAAVGDRVLLNTGAVRLGLGTGGFHFVAYVFRREPVPDWGRGHLMKLRYTPFQVRCPSAEEDDPDTREAVRRFSSLRGIPVVVCELHSQVPAAAAAIKRFSPDARVAYVMTDRGALPLWFSSLVSAMKEARLVDATVTAGHAFGGDMEAVNVYSAIIAAREAAGADAVVVGMGPGTVGTGSTWGFSGIEQGENLNIAAVLGGTPVAVLRLSRSDPRSRHRGLSHHTITALGRAALVRAVIAAPIMDRSSMQALWAELRDHGLCDRHRVVFLDGAPGVREALDRGIHLRTMGRGFLEEKPFFLAASAAGAYAAHVLNFRRRVAGGEASEEHDRFRGAAIESQGGPGSPAGWLRVHQGGGRAPRRSRHRARHA